MTRKWILLLGFLFISTATLPSHANDHALQTDTTKTQIVVDEEAGTVSIIINGKEVATFFEDGLHIWGDASYNGTLADGTPPQLQGGQKNEK